MAIATRSRKIKNHLLIEKISGLSAALIEKKQTCIRTIFVVENILQSRRKIDLYISCLCQKNGNEFLRHEVFGRLYMKKMGKSRFMSLINCVLP